MSKKLQAISYQLPVISYKLQETSFKLLKTSRLIAQSLPGTLMCATQLQLKQSDGRWLPKEKTVVTSIFII